LDPEQIIDEDTDLCMRLHSRKLRPWYEPKPGMVVYKGYVPARASGAQVTSSTPVLQGLSCYRRTHDKYLAQEGSSWRGRWFLATRYIRRAVKAGHERDAVTFAKCQSSWMWVFSLTVFTHLKQWSNYH
jgi:cellulose synthase/poly-beta-1,6-N-acetylglucosamine synthase-like glycosyltransferase